MTVEMWHPCRKGYPDPEHCPDCTPPKDQRCSEFREVVMGPIGNSSEPIYVTEYPCRVLGEHTVHRDGMGTAWWTEEEVGV